MFKIDLLTRDGDLVTFEADESETLLDAAARESIFLPSSCREGACGACRVTCVSGDVELAAYSASALSDAEREAGDILLCRAKALSDLSLQAPFDHGAISFAPAPERTAILEALAPAGSSAMRLVLRFEDDPLHGRAAEFIPGQFMELSAPGESAWRTYSLANTPNWDGRIEFFIRLQPKGLFSAYLKDRAKIGDRLVMRGPQGSFAVDETSQAPRWFIAGGTGLAPVLSILRQMAEFGDLYECRLFFGVNSEDDFFCENEIKSLERALPQLATTLCVWRPKATWTGFTGTPAEALDLALIGTATPPDIYVCGPPKLIEATITVGLKAGIAHDRIFSEQFSASAIPKEIPADVN